jgi:AraC family transcriptional regulator
MDEREGRYRRQLQSSIDFIEENLNGDFSLKDVASRANASLYHFHRLFRAFTGYSTAEYIRVRRLESAAVDLARTERAVIDIALDHGYSSPEAFLRAFKAKFGAAPREFRKRRGGAIGQSRIDLLDPAFARKKGRIAMQPRIVEIEGFSIRGDASRGTRGRCETDVPSFWEGRRGKADDGKMDLYGICLGFERATCASRTGGACDGRDAVSGGEAFSYVIGEKSEAPSSDETRVPGGRYAIFDVPEEIDAYNEALDRIYAEWLPSSGYELADSPVVERHSRGPGGKRRKAEIWLPLAKAGKA